MRFITYLNNLIRLFQLPKAHRQVVFYSEGKNYWTHLESLVNELLNTTEINVCYISSGSDDPGLQVQHPRYKAFITDEGFFRNWLFANIETEVLVMTMPDLHQFQVKRSKYPVHYIYVQHSLVSLHMAYRKGAFDYFDTIFCAGPHHYEEVRAMETKYNLPGKNLVKYGYPRLDSIKAEYKNSLAELKRDKNTLHALLAPSWGSNGTIESGLGLKVVDNLIKRNIKITLRPHPQTVKFARKKVMEIIDKYKSNALFDYEFNMSTQTSLLKSDFMISDWSGAALDYALALNKPVVFLDVPKKINNPDYHSLGIEPIEERLRNTIGVIALDYNNFMELLDFERKINPGDYVYNELESARYGTNYIKNLLSKKEVDNLSHV